MSVATIFGVGPGQYPVRDSTVSPPRTLMEPGVELRLSDGQLRGDGKSHVNTLASITVPPRMARRWAMLILEQADKAETGVEEYVDFASDPR